MKSAGHAIFATYETLSKNSLGNNSESYKPEYTACKLLYIPMKNIA